MKVLFDRFTNGVNTKWPSPKQTRY